MAASRRNRSALSTLPILVYFCSVRRRAVPKNLKPIPPWRCTLPWPDWTSSRTLERRGAGIWPRRRRHHYAKDLPAYQHDQRRTWGRELPASLSALRRPGGALRRSQHRCSVELLSRPEQARHTTMATPSRIRGEPATLDISVSHKCPDVSLEALVFPPSADLLREDG